MSILENDLTSRTKYFTTRATPVPVVEHPNNLTPREKYYIALKSDKGEPKINKDTHYTYIGPRINESHYSAEEEYFHFNADYKRGTIKFIAVFDPKVFEKNVFVKAAHQLSSQPVFEPQESKPAPVSNPVIEDYHLDQVSQPLTVFESSMAK